jgi:hypothetical protein
VGEIRLEGREFFAPARDFILESVEVGAEKVTTSQEFGLHSVTIEVPDGLDPVEFSANGNGNGGDPGEDGLFIRSVTDRGEKVAGDPVAPVTEESPGESIEPLEQMIRVGLGGAAPGLGRNQVGAGLRVGGLEFRKGGGIVVADLLEPGALLVQLTQLAIADLQFVVQPGDHSLALDHLPPRFALSGREALLALAGIVKVAPEAPDFLVAGLQPFIALAHVGFAAVEQGLERLSGPHGLVAAAAELVDLPQQDLALLGEADEEPCLLGLDFGQWQEGLGLGLCFRFGLND